MLAEAAETTNNNAVRERETYGSPRLIPIVIAVSASRNAISDQLIVMRYFYFL
jgi:hypothetical protein